AIVPIILGDEKRALHAQSVLEDEGFLVGAMRPPTVPHGTSRLRITFNAQIGDEDVIALAHIINKKGLRP
ncbi:MAG: 8-amino-7-oxononanoate synthase, partial [Sphingomonadales bacterium]|nr:8-amino-7-oxononanoate synthase [Sphingomonadales bacterium]